MARVSGLRRVITLLFGSLLLSAGCAQLLGLEEDVADGQCLLNSDCAPGKVCLFRVCSAACKEDKDCAAGSRCLESAGAAACVPDANAGCGTDGGVASCPDGTACAPDGTCRTVCGDCRADQACASGFCIGLDPTHDPAGHVPDAGASTPDATALADAHVTPDAHVSTQDATAADHAVPCSPSTCANGCCDSGGVCREDETAGACGKGGGSCETCTAAQACTGGACVDRCTAASCPAGCWTSTGDCVTTTTDDACGTNGAACGPCTGTNHCVDGQCGCATSADCPKYQACQADHTCANVCGPAATCNGGCCNELNGVCANTPTYQNSCGNCGGKIRCDGTCSIPNPGNYGKACGNCGGTYQCDGSCTKPDPGNYGKSCQDCGGTYQCDGSCTVNDPPGWGTGCATCGGSVTCNGSCSATTVQGSGKCGAGTGTELVAGSNYGGFRITDITLLGAPTAKYAFYIASKTGNVLSLSQNGITIRSVSYDWQAAVCSGCGQSVTFTFASFLSITVTSNGGSSNLYNLDTVMNSQHYISVCCP